MIDGGGLELQRRGVPSNLDQYIVLRDWIAETASPGARLLDIGAGDGDDAYTSFLRPLVSEMVGVDPDEGIEQNTALDRRYHMPIESFAGEIKAGHEQPFDLAVSVYVAEHVENPAAFLGAARQCLGPGGSLFLITPNLWHYFGVAAKTAHALGIEDRLLHRLRESHPEHQHVAHFRIAYRLNSVRALSRLGADAGFAGGEIRHLENPGIFEPYFNGRLASLPRGYSALVNRLGWTSMYGTLICRLQVPQVPPAQA